MSAPVLGQGGAAVLGLIIDGSVKGAFIFAAAALLATALRHSPASLRHSVWSAALAATLLVPPLSLVAPHWLPSIPAPSVSSIAPNASEGSWPLALALLAWLTGALATGVRFAAGRLSLWRYARQAHVERHPRQLALLAEACSVVGWRRCRTLLRAPDEVMPITWGTSHPKILLPPSSVSWPDELLRTVLLHELIHVKRRDTLTQAFAQLACTLFWFNPLVWEVARRLREERELACDEATVAAGTPSVEYAERLFELALLFRAPRGSLLAAGCALGVARESNLRRRIAAVLDHPTSTPTTAASQAAARAAVACAMLVLSVSLVAARPTERGDRDREQDRPRTVTQLPGSGPGSFRSEAAPRLEALFGR